MRQVGIAMEWLGGFVELLSRMPGGLAQLAGREEIVQLASAYDFKWNISKRNLTMTDGMDPDDQNPNRAAEAARAIRDFQEKAGGPDVTPEVGVNVGAKTAEALKAVVGSKRKLYCIYCAGQYPEGEDHVCPPEEDPTGLEARIAALEQRVDELDQIVCKLMPPDGPPPQTIDRLLR